MRVFSRPGRRCRSSLVVGVLAVGLVAVAACDGGGAGELDAPRAQDAPPADASGGDAACFNECQEGASQCANGLRGRSCGDLNGDSCREWLPYEECAAGLACVDNVGCVPGFVVQYQTSGPGRVAQNVGLSCTGCVRGYTPGTVVEVTAVPDTAAHFVGWSGGTCSGTGPCTVTGAATVVATFAYDCTSTVIDNQAAAGVVAFDGPYVYWTSFADDVIKRAPRGGGAAEVFASALQPVGLGFDGTYAYWSGNMLWRRAKAGGAAETVPLPPPPYPADGGIVTDATHVYWIGLGRLNRWPIAGGAVQLLATSTGFGGEHDGQDLALDADYVYWAARGHGTIARVPKAGGPVETIATGQVGAYAIALAGDDVYWTDYDAGVVARAPKAGGPTVIVSASELHPTGLAVEGGHVYWTASGSGSYISRVALGGTAVERLLSTPEGGGTGLAVDANSIYFNGRAGLGSALWRVPRGGTCAPGS